MSKKTILLVEDDATVRDGLSTVLCDEYEVCEAANCTEARRLLNKHIDLALIDYSLPDGDGCELLMALREKSPALPGIIMTGYGNECVAIKAIRAGATDYLKKPPNIGYLLARISGILNNEKSCEISGGMECSESRNEFIMDTIAAYIEQHYADEDLTLDKLASRTAMNKFRFCRLFKERHGCGYSAYLNKVRIKNACELLKNPDLPIMDVAFKAGYRNIQHFERVFKEMHGISPREYRIRANPKP